MVPVTFWLQLLLLVLTLRQSAAASDLCSELRKEISALKGDKERITEQKDNCEIKPGNCQELLIKQTDISQKTEALHNNLKKQLEAKEEVLKNVTDKQTQMQTGIDGLTKAVKTLNQKADLESGQWKAVQTAIHGLTKTVELINKRSQVLCETQKDICRALLAAGKTGNVDSAKNLVTCDSSDKCIDRERDLNTPLIYAALNGHEGVALVLLKEGAIIEKANSFGCTALCHAAMAGHLDVCSLLLKSGANVNSLNQDRDTPLHWAAARGHLRVVKLLVARGAVVSLKNNSGQTAWDVARLKGNEDVAAWLDSVSRV